MSKSIRAIEELEVVKKKIANRRNYISYGPRSHCYNGLLEAERIITKHIKKMKAK